MMKKYLSLAILFTFIFAGTIVSGNENQNTYYNIFYNFRIEKPKDWGFEKVGTVATLSNGFTLKNKELEKNFKENQSIPHVAIVKYTGYPERLNPNLRIYIEYFGNKDEALFGKVLNALLIRMKESFENFETIQDVYSIKINGYNSYRVSYKYTLKDMNDKDYHLLSTMTLFRKGILYYMIQTTCEQEGPDNTTKEFEEIIKSIKFDN